MEEKQMLYINVMICDSDSNRIIDLENKLEEIGELEHIKINIETRHELELQTIENWLPETYDILFINLDRETHQELARAGKIREKDEKIHMILTSENQENIQETFDLMPAVYLITPLEKESLRHWIQTIQKRVKDRRLYITFNYKRKTYHIPYREILYLESQQHRIRVVTAKESYTSTDSCPESRNRCNRGEKHSYVFISHICQQPLCILDGQKYGTHTGWKKIFCKQFLQGASQRKISWLCKTNIGKERSE
mgnify:CR=1 FL=1